MVKEAKRSVGIRLAFLHFRVYAFTGDMRRYHCSDFLTFHHLAAGLYGRLIFLDEWAAFPKKEKPGEW